MVPSFAAIPLNESLLFAFGAAVDGVDGFALVGRDIGRTWVVDGFPCARTALAAPRVRPAATATPITALVIGFMHSSDWASIPTASVVLTCHGLPQVRKRHVGRR